MDWNPCLFFLPPTLIATRMSSFSSSAQPTPSVEEEYGQDPMGGK